MLVLALITFGVSIGVNLERLDSIDSRLQKIEESLGERIDRIEAKVERHMEVEGV